MANRPTVPPDPKPAQILRAQLAYARAQGFTFDQARELAMSAAAGAADRQWRDAFSWSKQEWRQCYERRAPTRVASALEQLSLPTTGYGVGARDRPTPGAALPVRRFPRPGRGWADGETQQL